MKRDLRFWILIIVTLFSLSLSEVTFAGKCTPGGGNQTIYSDVCNGRQIPPDRTRRFRNLRLSCSSNADHKIRSHVPLLPEQMEKWRELDYSVDEEEEMLRLGKKKVFDIRSEMQAIWQDDRHKVEWSGTIPYETVESWDWTACEYGPDRSACGVTRKRVKVGTDEKGNAIYEDVEEVNSCWHDEDQSESRQCSVEQMNFDARFHRPTPAEWNPDMRSTKKGEGYYDIIPNKYDLLPGEVEDVQIFNTKGGFFSGRSEVMTPAAEVGDNWNIYDTKDIRAREELRCKFGKTYHIDVTIKTVKRRTDKKTPNAFKAPVDEFGRTIDSIRWLEVQSRKGKYIKKGEPERILLQDASAAMIAAMANQSRKFAQDVEKAKADVDREQRAIKDAQNEKQKLVDDEKPKKPKKADKNAKKKFHRNTIVRVKLFEELALGRDIFRTQAVFWTSGEMQVPGKMGSYEIRLGSQDPDKNAYKSKANFGLDGILGQINFNFRPNRKYYYEVSMFQEGVDFYIQEDGVFTDKFSKPLILQFKIEDINDGRGMVQRLLDFQGQRKSIFLWK